MRRRLVLVGAVLGLFVGVWPVGGASAAAAGWQSVRDAVERDGRRFGARRRGAPNSSYGYQATTRYGGPKACQHCPDPAIIVRASSDGGVSWGPERYTCACRNTKAQNDPQRQVATDGTVYATWLNDHNPGVVIAKSTDNGVTWSAPLA